MAETARALAGAPFVWVLLLLMVGMVVFTWWVERPFGALMYRTHTAILNGQRVRVTYAKRHWFFRAQLIGVEVWTGPHDNGGYGYTVWRG